MFGEDWINRSRGAITEQDRRFMLGEVDLSQYENPKSTASQKNTRIRQRTKDAILDFSLLAQALSAQDLDLMFGDEIGQDEFDAESDLHRALYGMVVLAVRLTGDFGVTRELIETAVDDALTQQSSRFRDNIYVGRSILHLEDDGRGNLEIPFDEIGESEEEIEAFFENYSKVEMMEFIKHRMEIATRPENIEQTQ